MTILSDDVGNRLSLKAARAPLAKALTADEKARPFHRRGFPTAPGDIQFLTLKKNDVQVWMP